MGKQAVRFKAAGAAMICMLVLTGCVQVNAAPATQETAAQAAQETAEPPVDGGTYATVVELRDAVVKAGLACPKLDEHDPMVKLMSRGDCSENTLIATYSSHADLQRQMDMYRVMGESMEITVLVGANWTINSPYAEKLKDNLGGYVYKSPGKK